MAAKSALQDLPVGSTVEERAPLLEFPNTVRSLLGVELGHAPVIEELASAHGIAEMRSPVVRMVHISHGGGDTALRHDGVRLAQQRFAHNANRCALGKSFDCRAQACATRANNQDIVFVCFVFCGHRILMSRRTPAATSRM